MELDDADVVEGQLHVLQHLGGGEGRTQQKLYKAKGGRKKKDKKKEQMMRKGSLKEIDGIKGKKQPKML